MENERNEEERRRKKKEEERRRKKKEEEKKKKIQVWNCDALNPRVSLITRQPMKFLWISDDPIPYCCVPFKEQNIGNYRYIGTWILRIYRKYR